MADEPLEVQMERARWDGRVRLATAIGGILTPIALAVLAYFTADTGAAARAAHHQSQQNAEHIKYVRDKADQNGAVVEDLRRNAKVIMYGPEAKGKE